eukprot:390843_1
MSYNICILLAGNIFCSNVVMMSAANKYKYRIIVGHNSNGNINYHRNKKTIKSHITKRQTFEMFTDPSLVGSTAIIALIICTVIAIFSSIWRHKLIKHQTPHQHLHLKRLTQYQTILALVLPILFILGSFLIMLSYYSPKIFTGCYCSVFFSWSVGLFTTALYGIKFGLVIGIYSLQIHAKIQKGKINKDRFAIDYGNIVFLMQSLFCFIISLLVTYYSNGECIGDHGCIITFDTFTVAVALVLMIADSLLITYFIRTVHFNLAQKYPETYQPIVYCSVLAGIIFCSNVVMMSMHIAYPEYNTLVMYNVNCIITAFCSFVLLQKLAKLPNIIPINDLKSENTITKVVRLRRLSSSISYFLRFYEVEACKQNRCMTNPSDIMSNAQDKQSSGINLKSENITKKVSRWKRLSTEDVESQSRSTMGPSQTNSKIRSLSPLEMSKMPSISTSQCSAIPTLTKDSHSSVMKQSPITSIKRKNTMPSLTTEIIESQITGYDVCDLVAYDVCDLCHMKILVFASDSPSERMKLHNKIFHTDYFE